MPIMAKEARLEIKLEPDLKEHVVEFYKTQPVNPSQDIRDFLVKRTKFKRKMK